MRIKRPKTGLKSIILLGVLLVVMSFLVIMITGRTCTVRLRFFKPMDGFTIDDFEVKLEEEGIVKIEKTYLEGDSLFAQLSYVSRGKTYIDVYGPDDLYGTTKIYAHRAGIITLEFYFGEVNGGWVIALSSVIFLWVLSLYLLIRCSSNMRRDMFSYDNIALLGVTIAVLFLLIQQAANLSSYTGPMDSILAFMALAAAISKILLPIAFIVSVFVMVTNIRLLIKEGRRLKNVLGTGIGLGIMLLTLAPSFIYSIMASVPDLEVQHEGSIGYIVEIFAENIIYSLVAYLECVLLATIILGLASAKNVPAFDRDYVMILGCRMKKDGTLTNLLKGRVDRAVDFAKRQKEVTGKDVVFVPSGGQGKDEPLSEAQAMKNYLLSIGIPEERILAEDRSLNTYQNFGYSKELIDRHFGSGDAKIAFSTTNYHVFRAGMYASKQGIRAQGMGSRTKMYFWVNAFAREFIATLESKKKLHMGALGVIIFLNLQMAVIFWLALRL